MPSTLAIKWRLIVVIQKKSFARSSRSRNLLSGKVLLIEVKLRSSSFVRGTFVVQVNPIKFVECGRNMADVQNTAI